MKKIKTPFILITLLLLSISEKNMAQNSSGDLAAINIKTFLPDQPENIPAEAIDLLTQMLQLEPSKRVTIKGALEHPFFHDLNSSTLR